MTENTPTEETPVEIDRGAPDETLQVLVSMSQRGSISGVGITLTVNGQIVTGNLVGRTDWFTALHETYGDRLGGLSEGFKEMDAALDEHDQDDDDLESFEYIHLVDARYLTGAGSYAPSEDSKGMFWRGRLSHVSGWSFGMFGPPPPSS